MKNSSSGEAQIPAALELLRKLCTNDEIHDLLAAVRGSEGVRLSARNKGELVENVDSALRSNALGIDSVFRLIQESEENGAQHIFFFKVPRGRRDQFSFENVASALSIPQATMNTLPRLELVPEGYSLADFRKLAPRRPTDWLVKYYKDETRHFFTGKIVPQKDTSKYLKEFDTERLRHVLLVRFYFPDILELRIPRDTSKDRMVGWLNFLWKEMRPAFAQSDVKDWDLNTTRANLIDGEQKHGKLYSLRDTQVETADHDRATFEPYLPGGGLFAKQHMRTAVGNLLKADGKCVRLNVTWLGQEKDTMTRDIRTSLGAWRTNEMIVSGHQTSREIDYVTEQLRRFSLSSS